MPIIRLDGARFITMHDLAPVGPPLAAPITVEKEGKKEKRNPHFLIELYTLQWYMKLIKLYTLQWYMKLIELYTLQWYMKLIELYTLQWYMKLKGEEKRGRSGKKEG